jgi:pyruvate kinase
MLSGESANGKYPSEAVDMMRKILEAADNHQDPLRGDEYFQNETELPAPISIARSAVHIAEESGAKAIIVEVTDETFVKTISHFRPKTAIIAVTDDEGIAKRLALVRGIFPFASKKKDLIESAKAFLRDEKLLEKDDKIICVRSADAITIETI